MPPPLLGRWNIDDAPPRPATDDAPLPATAAPVQQLDWNDRALALIAEQRAEIVELRAQRDVLIKLLERFQEHKVARLNPTPRPCKERKCRQLFTPTSNRQVRCVPCQKAFNAARAARWRAAAMRNALKEK